MCKCVGRLPLHNATLDSSALVWLDLFSALAASSNTTIPKSASDPSSLEIQNKNPDKFHTKDRGGRERMNQPNMKVHVIKKNYTPGARTGRRSRTAGDFEFQTPLFGEIFGQRTMQSHAEAVKIPATIVRREPSSRCISASFCLSLY